MKITPTYKNANYKIPICEKCNKKLVKFNGQWVCKTDMKLKVKALPFWDAEEVEFQVLYPNRKARRKQ